jgi:hypothetical protein
MSAKTTQTSTPTPTQNECSLDEMRVTQAVTVADSCTNVVAVLGTDLAYERSPLGKVCAEQRVVCDRIHDLLNAIEIVTAAAEQTMKDDGQKTSIATNHNADADNNVTDTDAETLRELRVELTALLKRREKLYKKRQWLYALSCTIL